MTTGARIAWVAAGPAAITAVLLVAERFIRGAALLTLPVSWPALFILGADETRETYGCWGELALVWLCSLPCIVAYAWFVCRWWDARPTYSRTVS